jgi:hypothetical protein
MKKEKVILIELTCGSTLLFTQKKGIEILILEAIHELRSHKKRSQAQQSDYGNGCHLVWEPTL